MTPITLHPHEVRASLAGRLGVIVRPLKPKREGWEFQGLNVHGQALFYPVGDLTPETEAEYEHWDGLMPPPIPEGPFWGRETWAPAAGGTYLRKEYGTVYRADSDRQMYWRGGTSLYARETLWPSIKYSLSVGDHDAVFRLLEMEGNRRFDQLAEEYNGEQG